jgi:hypothetical protein
MDCDIYISQITEAFGFSYLKLLFDETVDISIDPEPLDPTD